MIRRRLRFDCHQCAGLTVATDDRAISEAATVLKINGYTMFEDLVSAEKIDRLHDAFMPLLDAVSKKGFAILAWLDRSKP